MSGSHWHCLDCGVNTLHTDDYYMLRNKIWRQIVPREQRHGMLCLACMANRLGRPLTPSDFLKGNPNIDLSDPEEAPMDLEDYGIIDTLTPEALDEIDEGLIAELVPGEAGKVAAIIGRFMQTSPGAVSGLPDYFYLLRVEQMIDSGKLIVVDERENLMRSSVRRVPGG
jgi:hypothetical protein